MPVDDRDDDRDLEDYGMGAPPVGPQMGGFQPPQDFQAPDFQQRMQQSGAPDFGDMMRLPEPP
ncbi:MAG: hypothetical protein V4532_06090, partial [Pseudomonadota bacterium]